MLGFLLKTIRVPENPALENKYNSKLKTLSESTKGLVQILDENIIINSDTAILLEQKMNDMYSNRDRTEESIVFKELFDNMSNTSLTPVKNKMLEYIRNYGDEAQIKILNLLKNQGVIKKNVDNKLQLTEEPLLIEKFETIDSYINNIGLTPEVVQNEINKRKEINRKYVSDASDVVLNKSMSISEFFNLSSTSFACSKGNDSVTTLKLFFCAISITFSISFMEPISVPLTVFSSNAKKFGILPTVAIITVPPFFTDFIAVSVTMSDGAKTTAASK